MIRTIRCWALYNPSRRRIVGGHRTKKELKAYYPSGIPIGCVVVELRGQYAASSQDSTKEK